MFRGVTLAVVAGVCLVCAAAPASAFGPEPFPGDFDTPFPGGEMDSAFNAFGAFFILAIVLGVAGTIWKVSTARRMAEKAGIDPDDATKMALMTDDGLEATYLASSLRQPLPHAAAEPTDRPVAERLKELDALKRDGLITAEEYDERRKAILNDV